MADKPFTLTCNAGFRADGVWVIEITVRYRDGYPSEGSALLGEGRLALVDSLIREGLRGRSLGALHTEARLDEGRGEVVVLDPEGVVDRFTQQ